MAVKSDRPLQGTNIKEKIAKLLVVEAVAGDWQQHQERLPIADFEVETVTFGVHAVKRLENGGFDLVLLDGSAAETKAQNLLAKLRHTHPASELPVIMVTPESDSQATVKALEGGANDCVAMPLDRPVLIARIRAQLAIAEANQPKTKPIQPSGGSEEWLQLIMDGATTAIFETESDGRITRTNLAARYLTHRDTGELIGQPLGSLFADDSGPEVDALLARVAADGYFVSNHLARLRDEFGEERVLSLCLRRVSDEAQSSGVVATAEDVTETLRQDKSSQAATHPEATSDTPGAIASRAPGEEAHVADTQVLADNRSNARHRIFKGASLSFNKDQSVMDCVVRDISDTGAKLVFEGYFDCPRLARLRISDGRLYDCEVRWFANRTMGVSFLRSGQDAG